jgi:hypothetical protein
MLIHPPTRSYRKGAFRGRKARYFAEQSENGEPASHSRPLHERALARLYRRDLGLGIRAGEELRDIDSRHLLKAHLDRGRKVERLVFRPGLEQ